MTRARKLKLTVAAVALGAAGIGGAVYAVGAGDLLEKRAPVTARAEPPTPAISVVKAERAQFKETVLVTGTLVPREEILVAPEIEGFRVLDVLADEGQRVSKGDVLATLDHTALDAQVAQNEAALARTAASIDQARSQISESEARVVELRNALERAKSLREAGHVSEATFDTRQAAARVAQAQLVASRDRLRAAEAEKAEIEARQRELAWRRGRTEVRAPADGVVSRRVARIGALATGAADPMFRIIAKGEVELDAEVPEPHMARLKAGQEVKITVAGAAPVTGTVRLVSPEIDRATRLGRVRVFIGDRPELRIGAFARGQVSTATSIGVAVPVSAVQFGPEGATLQRLAGNRVEATRVETGLAADGLVEVKAGLTEGDVVVARAGTFLRDGDMVRPVFPAPDNRVSEAQ